MQLVFGLRVDDEIFVANIGDSRCVVAQQPNEKLEAKPLSVDHKPDTPEEKARIIKAGGRVEPLPGRKFIFKKSIIVLLSFDRTSQ